MGELKGLAQASGLGHEPESLGSSPLHHLPKDDPAPATQAAFSEVASLRVQVSLYWAACRGWADCQQSRESWGPSGDSPPAVPQPASSGQGFKFSLWAPRKTTLYIQKAHCILHWDAFRTRSLPLSPFSLNCASLEGPKELLQESLGCPWPRTWGGSTLSAED